MINAAMDDADGSASALIEEVEALRRRMLNVVGHELRTPITTLHGLAQQVMAADDLATVQQTLGPALLRNARRVERLLDDLLVAAGVGTALPVEVTDDVDVADLVEEVWASLQDPRPVRVEGPSGVHCRIPRETFRRVLEHVLGNASRYGAEGPTVLLAPSGGGDPSVRLQVEIRSPGPSLHPEELRLALEPFYRGERAVMSGPGLGIGLPVAERLLRGVGGGLVFGALLEGGTVTTLLLPSAQPPTEAAA